MVHRHKFAVSPWEFWRVVTFWAITRTGPAEDLGEVVKKLTVRIVPRKGVTKHGRALGLKRLRA